jgi:hypothetical protein
MKMAKYKDILLEEGFSTLEMVMTDEEMRETMDKYKGLGDGMADIGGASKLGLQVGGDHYKILKIQPIEYIMENKLNYCEGNVIKYVSRHRNKGGLADLQKAKHYIDLLIEDEYFNDNI